MLGTVNTWKGRHTRVIQQRRRLNQHRKQLFVHHREYRSTRNICDLPQVIQWIVFGMLEQRSNRRLALINHRFNHLSRSFLASPREVVLSQLDKNNSTMTTTSSSTIIRNVTRNIQSCMKPTRLVIELYGIYEDNGIVHDHDNQNEPIHWLRDITRTMTSSLRFLQLEGYGRTRVSDLSHLTRLEHLQLDYGNTVIDSPLPPNLRVLQIGEMGEEDGIEPRIRRTPYHFPSSLTVIQITVSHWDNGRWSAFESCPNLKRIKLQAIGYQNFDTSEEEDDDDEIDDSMIHNNGFSTVRMSQIIRWFKVWQQIEYIEFMFNIRNDKLTISASRIEQRQRQHLPLQSTATITEKEKIPVMSSSSSSSSTLATCSLFDDASSYIPILPMLTTFKWKETLCMKKETQKQWIAWLLKLPCLHTLYIPQEPMNHHVSHLVKLPFLTSLTCFAWNPESASRLCFWMSHRIAPFQELNVCSIRNSPQTREFISVCLLYTPALHSLHLQWSFLYTHDRLWYTMDLIPVTLCPSVLLKSLALEHLHSRMIPIPDIPRCFPHLTHLSLAGSKWFTRSEWFTLTQLRHLSTFSMYAANHAEFWDSHKDKYVVCTIDDLSHWLTQCESPTLRCICVPSTMIHLCRELDIVKKRKISVVCQRTEWGK